MLTAIATGGVTANPGARVRVDAVDIARGLVMVLMAIDHVRVYAGVPAGGVTFGLFFTRWITHFCAPAFIFLAGSSAWLRGQAHPGLPRYLLTRGAWLVLLELTVLRLAWTFNLDFMGYELAGVIWVIGWSMILMAPLVRLPPIAAGLIGLAIIAGHNLLDSSVTTLSLDNDAGSALWKIFYVAFIAGPIRVTDAGPNLIVLYSIVPWIGVMAAGYAFGQVLTLDAERRTRWCLAIGLSATVLFVLLRALNLYGDPRPWTSEVPFSFLSTTKYPASLHFLLMTLGPLIALLPLVDGARGVLAAWLRLFGRAPLFFYVLHIPLIHALALAVSLAREGKVNPWLFANHPMGSPPPPDGYTWSLPLLYLVWAIAVVLLYVATHWFIVYRSTSRTTALGESIRIRLPAAPRVDAAGKPGRGSR